MIHHLRSTLDRLEAVLDQAIAGMAGNGSLDHSAIASAKGRALLALSRLTGELGPAALPEDVRAHVERVRAKLAHEQTLLKRRLEASQLVVRLIADAVLAQDWDGTYEPVPVQQVDQGRARR